MTTPKEITATEKLLDLIRASSPVPEVGHHQERETDYHPPLTVAKSGMEREFAVGTRHTPPPELELLRSESEDVPVIVLGSDDDDIPPYPAAQRAEAAPGFVTIPPLEMHRPDDEAPSPVSLSADIEAPPPTAIAREEVTPGDPPLTQLAISPLEAEGSPVLVLTADAHDDPSPAPAAEREGETIDPVSALLAIRPPSLTQTASAAISRTLHRLRPVSKTTIAIDIQPGMIHLAKTLTSKGVHHLQECQSVPYEFNADSEPDQPYTDQEFMKVLFRTLSNFIPTRGHHEIWCSYFFCNPVGLHNISIPKVADKEIANAVFWSAKRELEFDEATTLFDYTVLQEVVENNQPKIQTLVTLVPSEELAGVQEMFKNAGFPLTGLTFPAAAIQNFLRQDQSIPADNPVVYFTIRRNSSFIDIFHHGKMFFSREIKTGTESFVESLLDQALTRGVLIDEEHANDYLFRPNTSPGESGPGSSEIFALLNLDELAVIDRLVRQLLRTFEYCSTTFKTPPVCKVFTSGEYTVNEPILQAIANRVGVSCVVLEPFSRRIFTGGVEATVTAGANLLVAAGLSLSDKQTTANFLFTHAERFVEAATDRLNNIIAIATIGLTIGSGVFFAWQYNQGLDKKVTIENMRAALDQKYLAEPRSRSADYSIQTIQKIGQFHTDSKQKVERFRVIIMLNELAKKIGPEISLTDLALDLKPKTDESRPAKDAPSPGLVRLNGYIRAPLETQEFILMSFLKTLTTLSLLGEPNLTSKENTTLDDQAVLRFEVNLKGTLGAVGPPPS
jgi:Tfp pilus assembly PilM family ATPase